MLTDAGIVSGIYLSGDFLDRLVYSHRLCLARKGGPSHCHAVLISLGALPTDFVTIINANHPPSSSPHVGWSRNWKSSGHICKPATYDSACLGFKIVNYLAASQRLAETVQPCYLYANERQALPSLIPAEQSLLEQPLSHTCT